MTTETDIIGSIRDLVQEIAILTNALTRNREIVAEVEAKLRVLHQELEAHIESSE